MRPLPEHRPSWLWTALLTLAVVLAFSGCQRYPSALSSDEQIQALVLEHVVSQLLERSSAGDEPDTGLLFLSSWKTGDADTSQGVLNYVHAAFQSARPYSAAAADLSKGVFDRSSGRKGVIIRVQSLSLEGDGPFTVVATYFVEPQHGMSFEYRVQRVRGRWKILSREVTKVA